MSSKSTNHTHKKIDPPSYRKLNIFSAGGKGGVGKTTLMTALAEWFDAKGREYVLLDLDTENRTKGGLQYHYRNAEKVDVNRQSGLDVFVDIVDRKEDVVLGDMGAGKGQATESWFSSFFEEANAMGVGFLLVCLVTPDPASIDSVLQWAAALQDQVQYLVVLNEMSEPGAAFRLWHEARKPQEFIERFKPEIMTMASRPSEFVELSKWTEVL